jgi:hypothetical protein
MVGSFNYLTNKFSFKDPLVLDRHHINRVRLGVKACQIIETSEEKRMSVLVQGRIQLHNAQHFLEQAGR